MKKITSIFVLALAAMLSVFASCNKLSTATAPPGVSLPTTPDSVTLKSHVIVIDSAKLILVSTDAQLAQGIYAYSSNTEFPGFIAGDIIVGASGDGYIRKITSVTTQQGQVVLNTTQAKLEDVFMQGNINFSTNALNGYQYNIADASLFQDANASATITGGNITVMHNWNFNMKFQNGVMTGFSAICNNAAVNTTLQLNVTSSASDNINGSNTLHTTSGRMIIWIGELPIVVTTELSFVASVSGNVTGSVNRTLSCTNNDTYTIGDVYAAGTWQNQYNFTHNSTLNATAPSAASLNVSYNVEPQMSVKLYGVVCPATVITANAYATGNISAPSGNWDLSAGSTQQPSFSVSAAILGYTIPAAANTWSTDTISYTTPYKVIKVSGDGQLGTAYQYLPQPLIVQVLDNNGNPQVNVPVSFMVTSGGGTLSNNTIFTNSSGYAQTSWQIGNPATTSQGVQVTVKMANGSQIIGSPISFIAL